MVLAFVWNDLMIYCSLNWFLFLRRYLNISVVFMTKMRFFCY